MTPKNFTENHSIKIKWVIANVMASGSLVSVKSDFVCVFESLPFQARYVIVKPLYDLETVS